MDKANLITENTDTILETLVESSHLKIFQAVQRQKTNLATVQMRISHMAADSNRVISIYNN